MRKTIQWTSRILLALLALLVLGAVIIAITLETVSGGYVKLRPDGVYTSERVMTNGSSQVLLIGVAHVADQKFYDEVFERVIETGSLVLAEGMTDKSGLVSSKFSYDHIAERLNLTNQAYLYEKLKTHAKMELADIDVSEFDQETLTFLRAIGPVMNGTATEEDKKLFRDSIQSPRILEQILNLRSQRLLEYFDKNHAESKRIAVPWGAAHMREIEQGFVKRGYERSESRSLRVTGYTPIFKMILESKASQMKAALLP